ncbi:nucleoside recognition protein [Roseibium sp.]|uniref:nucleoside recognition protein n=1 Tax=Roseibium sp. TaxID=1936156 RepID=UPI003A97F4C3
MASVGRYIAEKTRETIEIYWELVRIIVPVAVVTQVLVETGAIRAVAPAFAPLMELYGLPPALALAWLTSLLVGIWGAVIVVFALVPVETLTVADITILSSLFLFGHALPVEQRIIQKAGAGLIVTTVLRLLGGMVFAFLLHMVFRSTGWLSEPLNPTWVPMAGDGGWSGFLRGTIETLISMFVILYGLNIFMDLFRRSGLMDRMNTVIAPLFAIAGLKKQALPITAIGMFLGVSFGGGLLIREARSGAVEPRQVFLACIFMGFTHSVIEDTLVVVAIGADFNTVFFARLLFGVLATGLISVIIGRMPDRWFEALCCHRAGTRNDKVATAES